MATTKYGEDIAVLKSEMKEVKDTLKRIETKLDGQEARFASKWVQQVVGGLIGLILVSVVGALLALVIRSN